MTTAFYQIRQWKTLIFVSIFIVHGAFADEVKGFLEKPRRHVMVTSTIPDSGDQNPYAVIVAPFSSGTIQMGDVLIDNFNDSSNLQGTGASIVDYNPTTKRLTTFAQLPKKLEGCPGGVGLSTAMTMLKSGWLIVGSTPSINGTTATKGDGCLIILDNHGKVAGTIAGANINDPWGNMAVIDRGGSATLFVSNTGFGVGAPDPNWTVVNKATVLRIELTIADGKPPVVKNQTVIASGLSERAARDVFIIGPTGLALGQDGKTLYVSDALNNRVIAIPDAPTRDASAGTGVEVTKDGLLHRPLAMILAPNGHLLVTNGRNGQVVEIDPVNKKQVYAQWLDTDKAQVPPGSGDLFGIALTLSGDGFYYVDDDMNLLELAQ
jgi:DNA-binding beta-propeller fold protein YncE